MLMSSGYTENNPVNLRNNTGFLLYQGEINNPLNNSFRAFSSMPYGVRAWLMNLYTKITVDGQNTYQDYLSAYAPVSDGNSSNYPLNVVGSDFSVNSPIDISSNGLQTLFFDQIRQEIGSDAVNVSESDFQAGLSLFNNSVPGWVLSEVGYVAGSVGVPPFYFFIAFLIFMYAIFFDD